MLSGTVDCVVPTPVDQIFALEPGICGIIPPGLPHRLLLRGPVRLRVAFLRPQPQDEVPP